MSKRQIAKIINYFQGSCGIKACFTIATLFVLASTPVTTIGNEILSWTSKEGKTIQAEFVRFELGADGDPTNEAFFIRKGGREFRVPFKSLNKESREQAYACHLKAEKELGEQYSLNEFTAKVYKGFNCRIEIYKVRNYDDLLPLAEEKENLAKAIKSEGTVIDTFEGVGSPSFPFPLEYEESEKTGWRINLVAGMARRMSSPDDVGVTKFIAEEIDRRNFVNGAEGGGSIGVSYNKNGHHTGGNGEFYYDIPSGFLFLTKPYACIVTVSYKERVSMSDLGLKKF